MNPCYASASSASIALLFFDGNEEIKYIMYITNKSKGEL